MSVLKYQKLDISFDIPEELEHDIDEYIKYLNDVEGEGIGVTDDCYRTEILCTLNWCLRESILDGEQIKQLKDYYVWCGIKDCNS